MLIMSGGIADSKCANGGACSRSREDIRIAGVCSELLVLTKGFDGLPAEVQGLSSQVSNLVPDACGGLMVG
jgi:hypothetical protein